MTKKVERYKRARKLKKIEQKQLGQIGLNNKISCWWLTKVIVKFLLLLKFGLFLSLLKLILQAYDDTKTGKCYQKCSIPNELKSISSAGLRTYLRLKWEEIKDPILSLLS